MTAFVTPRRPVRALRRASTWPTAAQESRTPSSRACPSTSRSGRGLRRATATPAHLNAPAHAPAARARWPRASLPWPHTTRPARAARGGSACRGGLGVGGVLGRHAGRRFGRRLGSGEGPSGSPRAPARAALRVPVGADAGRRGEGAGPPSRAVGGRCWAQGRGPSSRPRVGRLS